MQLVANFGEIRTNHWHMGLDIRTQQKVNLPVHAAADGYIARVSVEPGGFGQAIYINHPNGFTTVYGHLNSFFPALDAYVKQQQYARQSWKVSLSIPPDLFPVQKGDLIARSGSTGASEGPHVHFEIRDTKTENCLNPLLFGFPIADAVPPTLARLAVYDRNQSTYAQSPKMIPLKRTASGYAVPNGTVHVNSNKISFAIGASDRFTGSSNPNGIYSARISVDDQFLSGFTLDNISYNDTRYINAQLDYPFKSRGGGSLQHLTPLPGACSVVYSISNNNGLLLLKDNLPHAVLIEVSDANGNTSTLHFSVQKDETQASSPPAAERFLPNNVNILEREGFELFTTEWSVYDTVVNGYSLRSNEATGAASPLFTVLSAAIPSHDSITVRIRPTGALTGEQANRVVIKNTSGTKSFLQRGVNQKGWYAARFRQFGNYQAFVDTEPPTVNAPPSDLTRASRIVFVPRDNFEVIRNFRAELDGQWLRFSNDKGHSWMYTFDEKFPPGDHELKLTIEDEAGNITTKSWRVKR